MFLLEMCSHLFFCQCSSLADVIGALLNAFCVSISGELVGAKKRV